MEITSGQAKWFAVPSYNQLSPHLENCCLRLSANWMERAIRIRKQCPEFGCGQWHILKTEEPSIFAHCCERQGKAVIALQNLFDKECTVTLKLQEYVHLFDLFGDRQYEALDGDSRSISLAPYGDRQFRVNRMY